jgi:long-chain acyl-CoA synthetase
VAPAPIENKLKESFFIEQVALVGDGRKFVAALIIPNFEQLKSWCAEQGIVYDGPEQIVKNTQVRKKYMDIVNEFNVHFGKVEQVKMIALLAEEWSVESGELTPTMKLRRKAISTKYQSIIESFFD